MKNKIKQFAKGDFKAEQPDIQFSTTQISMSVGEGEVYEGSFLIENTKGGNIRGLVYPSSFRVHCLEEGFDGNPVKVNFTYDSTGMFPGETEKGKFAVVCSGGEYELDFTAIIEKPYIMTAYGKVQTIEDVKKLAGLDFGEAQRIFRSKQFYDILKYEDRRIQNLYDNMRKWSLDERALEEFLVGIKQKEKIFLSLSQERICHEDIFETQRELLEFTKNTWGYVSIKIETEGDFLEAARSEITTDDFVGNNYGLEYYIHADKLHAGHNYGRILVSTPYETLCVVVDVHQRGHRDEMRGMKGMIAGQGLKEYLAFIAGKTGVDEWTEKAIRRVKQLQELEPENEHYRLLEAHIYLRARRDEEAKWVLENNYQKFAIGRKPEINAYYLFLTALLKKDTIHTNRVLEELNRTFMKHLYSWPILCMIVNLDSKYRDYNDRIRVLERQFFNGANQILLYAEAYLCFQEKVLLLRKLDSFEVQILNFATKYRLITRELALHMADLVCQQKKYDTKLLMILERAYEMYEEPRILNAICMQLIKGNKVGNAYFKWYQKAAEQGMKIAQLYEYYMMSVNPERITEAFPRIVYLYFLHGINLENRRTALLYENILTYEKEDGEIYNQYYEQIRAFAREQLMKRRVNESLRVIYNRFILPNDITLDELDALYDICHAYHVSTKVKGIKYVLVIEKDGSIKQRVAYKDGVGARVYLYDKDARIVWEADNGKYYIDSIPYETKRLFYEMRYLELCKNRILNHATTGEKESTKVLTFDVLKQRGIKEFDKQEVFRLCVKRIREEGNGEDDFLLHVCYELLAEECYDKTLLHYLAQYYCGATIDMKRVWKVARAQGVNTKPLAERIITQMLFSETMFQEEAIFRDYYEGKPYFRLKQAYLAYVSRLYVVQGRDLPESIVAIILKEYTEKEYLADICKAAILQYFADRPDKERISYILKNFFTEMCEKNLVLSSYLSYPQEWLNEVQLYDKVMVEYHASMGGKVKLFSRIRREGELPDDYRAETLLPVYDSVYVKEVVLYEGEILDYYFEEDNMAEQLVTEKAQCKKENIVYEDGKYGRLNLISRLSKEKQYEVMLHYKKEERLAKELFQTY